MRDVIDVAAMSSDRTPDAVTIIGASKMQELSSIYEAADAGISIFGENKAQELIAKFDDDTRELQWHFIGQIQSNKLKKIASRVTLIHSIDSAKHIDVLAQCSHKPEILIQLSSDGDPRRGGVTYDNVEPLIDHARASGLTVQGIMHVPPPDIDPRIHFDLAKKCLDQHSLSILSMGMSGDFALAIEYGSTMVRLGSTIFGPRLYQ